MPLIDDEALDDPRRVAAIDTRDTLRALATGGAQVREAITLAQEAGVDRLALGERPRSVLIASLGGSAVVADVLDLLAEPSSPVPVTVRRNLPVPGWVGALDLVVAVSLSGRAPGPLAVAAEAARRGASLVTVGAQDSPLAAVCAAARGVHMDIGKGRMSSRTSLWSLLVPVLIAADRAGVVSVPERTLLAAADRLNERAEACRPSSESFVNPAKAMALQLAETVPVVGGEGVGAPYPPRDIFADPFLDGPAQPQLGLLLLREAPTTSAAPEDVERTTLVDGVVATAQDAGVRVLTVVAEPGEPLVRLTGLMATTDYIATYLAIAFGMDPAVSRHVTELRDRTRV